MKLNDYGIIIQARMASTRLPGKTLLPLNNGTILDSVISRCSKSICKKIIVATSKNMEDDLIEEHCRIKKYNIYRGSNNNVLKRIIDTAKKFKIKKIIRVTADNPFVGFDIINYSISFHEKNKKSIPCITDGYSSKLLPNGTVISIFDIKALEIIYKKNFNNYKTKEHLILGLEELKDIIFVNKLKVPNKYIAPKIRYCLDNKEDYEVIKKIDYKFKKTTAKTEDIIKFIKENKEIIKINYKYAKNVY